MPQDEWYTPAVYLQKAHRVFPHGRIGLDPYSNDYAQRTVKADHYFTIDDDATQRSWKVAGGVPDGSVFMNPPYSRGNLSDAIDKFIREYRRGSFAQGIILVNNTTEARWFQRMLRNADALCLTNHRISFIYGVKGERQIKHRRKSSSTPKKKTKRTSAKKGSDGGYGSAVRGNVRGQAFFYFGPDVHKFAREFEDVGCVIPLAGASCHQKKKSRKSSSRSRSSSIPYDDDYDDDDLMDEPLKSRRSRKSKKKKTKGRTSPSRRSPRSPSQRSSPRSPSKRRSPRSPSKRRSPRGN